MIKYEIKVGRKFVYISLDANSPNQRAELVYTGDSAEVGLVRDFMEKSYGAFGHAIDEVASPIDLSYALKKSNFPIKQISGIVVEKYDPDIPEGSIT